MSTKKRRPPSPQSAPTSRKLLAELAEAETLMTGRRWIEARDLLESLHGRYPGRVDVLTLLVNACYELQDLRRYLVACERLVRLTPNNPEVTLALAGAYVLNVRPVQALLTFRRFLDRWPGHDGADRARQTVAELEARMEEILDNLGLRSEDGFELAALHEEAQSLLRQGQYAEARKVEHELLRRLPGFAPALNNLSLLYFIEGDLGTATTTTQRALALHPNNVHALSNLIRYLCLSGRTEEAQPWVERLRPIETTAVDVWLKKAEALSYLGDDQGVLDAFRGAERAGHLDPTLADPLLYHLAAVAAMRLGREAEAHQHWQEALKLAPGHSLSHANLADLRQPISQRHAPWAFGFSNWLAPPIRRDLTVQLEPVASGDDEAALTEAARRFLNRYPEVVGLVPLLLDRGDPEAREFALHLARVSQLPELLVALRDFALSQRGPDTMRLEAARAAAEAGLLAGPVGLWLQGEWREVIPGDG
jgi:tetratricopeptide (TPR) repeat protein